MQRLIALAALGALCLSAAPANAQSEPSGGTTMIVLDGSGSM